MHRHTGTAQLTFHLRFVLGQTPLLLPQLSVGRHHRWPLQTRLSPRPSFLNVNLSSRFTVAPSEIFRSRCLLRLCCQWPFTPDPLALLFYSCDLRIGIGVDRLRSAWTSVGLWPLNPQGFLHEGLSIDEQAWRRMSWKQSKGAVWVREKVDIGDKETDSVKPQWENERARGRG